MFGVRISCGEGPSEVHTSCDETRAIIVTCFGLANEVRYLHRSWVVDIEALVMPSPYKAPDLRGRLIFLLKAPRFR
jgi:hypothetical protein